MVALSAAEPSAPVPAAPESAPAPSLPAHDWVHLAAWGACTVLALGLRVGLERPKVTGALAWALASGLVVLSLAAIAIAVHALVRRLVPRVRVWRRGPKVLLAEAVAALRQHPGVSTLRILLGVGVAASLLAVVLLPATYSAHLAAGPVLSPTASPALEFARRLPLAALATYLAGFWTAWFLVDVDLRRALRWYRLATRRRPASAAILSYAAVGLIGTWLLSLPFVQRDMLGASLLTSFFTSFSALTTTGLTNVDIAAQWNSAGHLVIACIVLVGGLGIFMLWAVISTAARRLAHVPGATLGSHELQDPELQDYFRRALVFFFATLLVGVVALFLVDGRTTSVPGRAFRAFFHGVSAFCNAGFTLDNSVRSFGGSYAYGGVMSLLVVLGGLGPAVVLFPRSKHARVAALLSAALIVVGTLLFYLLDLRDSSNNLVLSLYQSIAARTAGFGWVDLGRASDAALLWLMALMFVGACPGGTGGGVKATLLYTLRRAFLALGQGLPADDRRMRESAVESMEAFVAVGFFGVLAMAGTLVLSALESQPALSLLFEVVSALSTTGLSRNLTPLLSPASLVVLVVLMVAGKIGPLLALQALFRSKLGADDFLERIKEGRVLTV